ncbi:hypothetical protein OK015_28940 (plasmid) [Mycobacterium sp. Aquia_216]|uniref:hypothetical protein n=1 Tax=Mycobacterium sp. Aquia_216 TaxID=2991729 RepID=UPI00227D4C87|nr:hypothetical protein [Mycobacterium sp. Aquia_216]WAJ47976.1 hypothetical protein OK015_28940 [Mycobacterium sp. Aquia_216]
MTAQLDYWASTDHDPTSMLESIRGLTPTEAPPTAITTVDIDELAVLQVAHDGQRMRLRGADRDEAIRRMHGRVDIDLVAWRLHTTSRTVHRVAARLGLTLHKPTPADQFGDRSHQTGPSSPRARAIA